MKVLLINPEKLINPPLGLLYIGSILKAKGHQIKLTEIPYGLDPENRFVFIADKIHEFNPDILGITCMSMQARICEDLIRSIKKKYKSIRIVAGGVHPTIASEEVMSWGTDIVVTAD